MCRILFENEKDYIVMESDILWNNYYNTPEDDYCEFRRAWMRICACISQIGKPVVLCGCAVPKQFEAQSERQLFSDVHYLSVVCDNNTLEKRMREGRGVTDEHWINSSLEFNNWLKENADKTSPKINLLDTTNISAEQTAEFADEWIINKTRSNKNET
ncbi:MAG: hypothetical protein A2Y17_00915 [Clostridiales bacterium GWF2_38_85]|nr:MAG: hypothetical protein A2Y17_00915 [Clostridiales bacterium GWF2_38_85]